MPINSSATPLRVMQTAANLTDVSSYKYTHKLLTPYHRCKRCKWSNGNYMQ